MSSFTPVTLPHAVKVLLALNNYTVDGPIQIYGAEIDLKAQSSDPLVEPIYIETTVEYVDNDKYGRDLTKFAIIKNKEPLSQCIIVSSKGFSLPVQERASESNIKLFTYEELFRKFQKFEPYISQFSDTADLGIEYRRLNNIYEEPLFEDRIGSENAINFLNSWRDSNDTSKSWLIIVGEYGTGKTALTKILQYRWLNDYKINPSLKIPFRMELREFTRQFDARGLIHHFLDHNFLSHISIDFAFSLIRTGKIILILDGYDEMAQYLNSRERRLCLEALAELSSGGAKGILTSRPNYFTEAEELNVFETLYSSLEQNKYYLTRDDRLLLEREKAVDNLLGRFLDKYERTLKDLTPEQTETLIKRILSGDSKGIDVILNILKRIYRAIKDEGSTSITGKPVIITYLLEVVETLKETEEQQTFDRLNEWQIYKLIVDQLMIRDLKRTPSMEPNLRRRFLSQLALFLSRKEKVVIFEDEFKDLISKELKRQITRHSSDARADVIEQMFSDLRTSSTLTRASDIGRDGWRFSHNSLREYLVAEYIINNLNHEDIRYENIPISDAMRLFCNSMEDTEKRSMLSLISRRIANSPNGLGAPFTLLWDSFLSLKSAEQEPILECLKSICGENIVLRNIDMIDRIKFSTEETPTNLEKISFEGSSLYNVNFTDANLKNSSFANTELENVLFCGADLSSSCFRGSLLLDIDLFGAVFDGADFSEIDSESISIFIEDVTAKGRKIHIHGTNALGFLNYNGAKTINIDESVIYKHHPKYSIVEKISEKLSQQTIRQKRGLVQRGAAREDIPFSEKYIEYLERKKLIKTQTNRRDLVEVTETGRKVFSEYISLNIVPNIIIEFIKDNR